MIFAFLLRCRKFSDLRTFCVMQLMLGLTRYQSQFFFDKVDIIFDKLDIILVNFDINVDILETLFFPTSEEDFCVKFN